MSNLPVRPYDKPARGRDLLTGQFDNEEERAMYVEDVIECVADASDAIDDVRRLIVTIDHHVGHVATRETCKHTLSAALSLLLGAQELLRQEADS